MQHTQTTTTFADTKPHYELLDGLRGVAAILVVFYHIFEGFFFAEGINTEQWSIMTTLNHGYMAVDFFFILSGFVISYAYDDRWQRMTIGSFFKRRLIRLHPMVIAGAVIGTITFIAAGCKGWYSDETISIGWVMTAMLLTMLMIPALPGVPYEVRGNGELFPLNGPIWSLFFEYIGNILYALFIRRFSTKMLAAFTALLGIAYACFFVGDMSGCNAIVVGWTFDSGMNFGGSVLRMLFPFCMGMLIARTFKPRKVKGAFWICSIILAAVLSAPHIAKSQTSNISLNSLYEFICITAIFPLLVWLGACGNNGQSFTNTISKKLGEISYPLYLTHYPLMYVFYAWLIDHKCYTLGEGWIGASIVTVSSIVLAFLLLKLYDEPVRKWLSQKFNNKH